MQRANGPKVRPGQGGPCCVCVCVCVLQPLAELGARAACYSRPPAGKACSCLRRAGGRWHTAPAQHCRRSATQQLSERQGSSWVTGPSYGVCRRLWHHAPVPQKWYTRIIYLHLSCWCIVGDSWHHAPVQAPGACKHGHLEQHAPHALFERGMGTALGWA